MIVTKVKLGLLGKKTLQKVKDTLEHVPRNQMDLPDDW
jgi:hypothetical protein